MKKVLALFGVLLVTVMLVANLQAGVGPGTHSGHGQSVEITITTGPFDYKISADGDTSVVCTPDTSEQGTVEESPEFSSPTGTTYRVRRGRLQWKDSNGNWWYMNRDKTPSDPPQDI